MQKKLRNWKTELSWTKYREQTFLRYITWNLVVFSRLFDIYKVTEWMNFIQWSSMNGTFNGQARKVESWMSERNLTETALWRCSTKQLCLETAQNTQKNTCTGASFYWSYMSPACNSTKKGTQAQVFPCCDFSNVFNLVGVLMLESFSWPLPIKIWERKPFTTWYVINSCNDILLVKFAVCWK